MTYFVGKNWLGKIVVIECDGIHSTEAIEILGAFDDKEKAERFAGLLRWQVYNPTLVES